MPLLAAACRSGRGVRPRPGAASVCRYRNSRSTFGSACAASDSAVDDNCWRVCKARRFAPSALLSASVRLAEPDCSVLTIALVKSWRICTVDRLELNVWDSDCNEVSAALRAVDAAVISDAPAQLLAALAMLSGELLALV